MQISCQFNAFGKLLTSLNKFAPYANEKDAVPAFVGEIPRQFWVIPQLNPAHQPVLDWRWSSDPIAGGAQVKVPEGCKRGLFPTAFRTTKY